LVALLVAAPVWPVPVVRTSKSPCGERRERAELYGSSDPLCAGFLRPSAPCPQPGHCRRFIRRRCSTGEGGDHGDTTWVPAADRGVGGRVVGGPQLAGPSAPSPTFQAGPLTRTACPSSRPRC
jgi:hypothetical protein